MTGPARVGAFALVLVMAFAAATAIGYAVGPLDRGRVATEPAHGDEPRAEPAPPAASGWRLRLLEESPLTLRVEARGRAVRDFDTLHERRMHVIVVRNDLATFRHLHPEQTGATWRTPTRLPAGAYTVFADFQSQGRRAVVSAPLTVPGRWRAARLPAAETVAQAGPYDVELEAEDADAGMPAMLSFRVRRGGEEVAVDPYLGARGHLVIVREGDVAYLHTHAEEDELDFETTFPSEGRYRAFLQFSSGGEVLTAAFTIELAA